jgi:hypothetical protein
MGIEPMQTAPIRSTNQTLASVDPAACDLRVIRIHAAHKVDFPQRGAINRKAGASQAGGSPRQAPDLACACPGTGIPRMAVRADGF